MSPAQSAPGVVADNRRSRKQVVGPLITITSLLVQVLGSFLFTEALAAKPAAPAAASSLAPLLYSEPAPCSGCGATVSLTSAGLQQRAGSVLFDLHGSWPATAAQIPSDMRLVVNDLHLVLRPPASGDVFSVVSLTKANLPAAPTGVAVALQGDALLIDLPTSLVTAPLHFEFGLWSGAAYTSRLPRAGQLLWEGAGAPHPPAPPPSTSLAPETTTTSTAPPSSSSVPTTASPAATGAQITALAEACAPIPSGSVPAALAITAVAGGNQPPPGAGQAVRWVGVRFAAPLGANLAGQPALSVTATLLPATASPPASGRPIDRVGTVQLWLWWDGSTMHRGSRTFDGTSWQMRVDPADLQVSVSAQQIQFFSPLIGATDGYGFVVAVSSGCEASAAPGRNPATGR